MTKNVLQIESLEANEILNRFDRLERAIDALANNPTTKEAKRNQNEYISRREVSRLFKVSLVTIDDWTSKGILQAYKVGRKVYFKPQEVENAFVKKYNLQSKTNG